MLVRDIGEKKSPAGVDARELLRNWFVGSDWTTVLDYQRLSNRCIVAVTDYT